MAVNELSKNTNHSIFLHLFGEGEILNQLKDKYAQNANITFYGFVLNVIDYLREMDVCLLPSYYHAESMPFSVIEYLSIAKPVIASRIGYIEEMIRVESNLAGFLIEVNNGRINEEQLQRSMLAYIENPTLIEDHAKLAEKAFKQFDIDNCTARYIKLYTKGAP